MTDVLFLSKGRPEFTKASWAALQKNTPDATLWILTDGDESQELTGCEIIEPFGGPVACINAFLDVTRGEWSTIPDKTPPSEFIAKVDNDTIVPPGWLEACENIMLHNPEVDLLGIEPWTPDAALFPRWVEPLQMGTIGSRAEGSYTIVPRPRIVSHIGGIGVFRRSAFERFGRPTPNTKDGRYGFTEWQWAAKEMVKAFIDPPLPVFLLDHLPFPPWIQLSKKYEGRGEQRRQWEFYDPIKHKALWDWWIASGEGESERVGNVGGPQR